MPQRTYAIGRSADAPIRIPDDQRTVSMMHAEITETADGRLYLTDRQSTNGTAVFRHGDWRTLRQDFVDSGERIRLGAYETTVAQLLAGLPERRAAKPSQRAPTPAPARAVAGRRRPRRNPETGEIIED